MRDFAHILGVYLSVLRFRRVSVLAIAMIFAASCNRRPSPPPQPQAPAPQRARIVLVVVLDQVGTAVLERALPHLRENGAIRQTIARGSFFRHSVYPYAATYTAPGHAAIFTGASPRDTGVVANRVWDPTRRRIVSVVDDGTHRTFGLDNGFAAPSALRAEVVGDVLKRESGGRARVVALSIKDRCAVIPGGRRPDAAVWFESDAHVYTTSSYYTPSTPAWLTQFLALHPADSHFEPWTLLDPREASWVPDTRAGEGDWHGFGAQFPHDIRASDAPYEVFTASPNSAEHLLELADAATEQFQLGADEHADLLAVSISSTDYVGHVFGAESLEALDNLIRVDLALARFIERLERRAPTSVLITADHGVAILPETARAQGGHAERLDGDALAQRVEAALVRELGPGPWVEAFQQPFLYLNARANAPDMRTRAVSAAIQTFQATNGVHAAFDTHDRAALEASSDPVRRAVALSIAPNTLGDVFVVPARQSIVDENMPTGYGTSHGSPWEYDTNVPVLIRGPGVQHQDIREPVSQLRVAATISALLHVSAPARASELALPY